MTDLAAQKWPQESEDGQSFHGPDVRTFRLHTPTPSRWLESRKCSFDRRLSAAPPRMIPQGTARWHNALKTQAITIEETGKKQRKSKIHGALDFLALYKSEISIWPDLTLEQKQDKNSQRIASGYSCYQKYVSKQRKLRDGDDLKQIPAFSEKFLLWDNCLVVQFPLKHRHFSRKYVLLSILTVSAAAHLWLFSPATV